MKVSLFYLPSLGSKADIEAGMAGMRADLYQQMLREVSEQCRLADELGYESVSFTEHHFHIEGFEVSNNPVLLDLYIAMQTKRIRVGQLGIVLPASNPIRVAEDIAMLDHMTGGRACAGFARGYQRRWVDIMAQQTHGIHGALPHQHDEIDAANRAAFEECFTIIKKCWTEEMLSFQGKFWKIPPGETPWPLETTAKWGKGVENGILKAVGVVPKPLQKPHPPIFQPFASSENSIRWCAKNGVTAILPPMHETHREEPVRGLRLGVGPQDGRRHGHAARHHHRRQRRGGTPAVGRTRRRLPATPGSCRSASAAACSTPRRARRRRTEEAIAKGYALVGTVDTVTKSLEALKKKLPVNWIFAWTHNTLVPHAKLMRSIELFHTQVLPRVS